MGLFNNIGTFAHNSFIKGSGMTAGRHMANFGTIGAIGNAGLSYMNGESIPGGAIDGAILGVGAGAAMKYASNMYTRGAINLIEGSTNAQGHIYKGVERNTQQTTPFNIYNFTRPNNSNIDMEFFNANTSALTNTRWQHYAGNLDITNADKQYIGSKWAAAANGREVAM